MTIVVIIAILYLCVASLVAINSVMESRTPGLSGLDAFLIASVSLAWPVIGGYLTVLLIVRALTLRRFGESGAS